jgi:outer membrane protein
MKKTNLAILAFTTLSMVVVGQGLTLRQCVEYANSNNGNIKNSTLDIQISDKKIDEQIGSMLPQIDETSSYTDNLIIPTTLIPTDAFGGPAGSFKKAQFGTNHNFSSSLQLTQKLFDPTFDVALKAVKISKAQAIQSKRKTLEQTAYAISGIYYQTLVIGKQIATLHTTMEASQKSLEATELKFKNGMAKKVDVDKIRVSYNNIKSQAQQSELSYLQSLNSLKFQMGMTVETPLVLSTDAIDGDIRLFEMPENNFQIDNRIDYQLQKINLSAYELEKKRQKDSYLPTLSFNANFGVQAMRQEFDFFRTDGNWFPNSSIGLTLKVPIFDGLQKQARITQAQLNIQKSKISIQQTEESIKVDLSNYDIQYRNAIDNIKNEKENLDLAESVYKNFQNQFKQGICSTLDLVQAQSSYSESQNIYYNKLLTLYIARINLEQTKGTLINYINNQK